jgi:hypothetical protein
MGSSVVLLKCTTGIHQGPFMLAIERRNSGNSAGPPRISERFLDARYAFLQARQRHVEFLHFLHVPFVSRVHPRVAGAGNARFCPKIGKSTLSRRSSWKLRKLRYPATAFVGSARGAPTRCRTLSGTPTHTSVENAKMRKFDSPVARRRRRESRCRAFSETRKTEDQDIGAHNGFPSKPSIGRPTCRAMVGAMSTRLVGRGHTPAVPLPSFIIRNGLVSSGPQPPC